MDANYSGSSVYADDNGYAAAPWVRPMPLPPGYPSFDPRKGGYEYYARPGLQGPGIRWRPPEPDGGLFGLSDEWTGVLLGLGVIGAGLGGAALLAPAGSIALGGGAALEAGALGAAGAGAEGATLGAGAGFGAGAGVGGEVLAAPLPATLGASGGGSFATGLGEGAALAPEFEGGTFGATGASSFTGGASSGPTVGQALRAASLANSAANLGQNPGGGSAGSFIGNVAGAATGIPGASTVGSVAGGTVGRQFDSSSGGSPMAETGTPGTGQDIASVLFAALGLGGAGLGLADQARLRGQQNTLFGQSQEQLRLINALAALYNNQSQQAFAQQQAVYPEQVLERAQDRANRNTVFGERQGIGERLADPTQVAAGAQTLFNPYAAGVQDETVRAINRSQALAGTGDGGVANLAAARALTPLNAQLYQQAMQNFLGSQTSALGAFNYPPEGPYTPDVPKPPQPFNPQLAGQQLTPPPAFGGSPGEVIGNLVRLLGLGNTPGAISAVGRLLGLGGGETSTPEIATATIQGFRDRGFTQGIADAPSVATDAGNFDYSNIDLSSFEGSF